MSEFPNIEKLREAVSSEGRVVDHLCDSFSNHTWVRLNLVNPIRRAFGAARFLLSLLDEGGRLVVEAPCEHGELIDPANVDYEAAAKHFCEVIHPEYENKPCGGHLEWVNDLVGLALGVGEPGQCRSGG